MERWRAAPEVTEKHMSGGVAFLRQGNMAVGVTGNDLLGRVGPDGMAAALTRPGTRVFDMSGRPMRDWIMVDGATVMEDDTLGAWLDEGRAFAAGLPPK
ncbi:TfoX/Sxy family protein [Streptomyces iakyrus]|uniref:TfoX/Sxy family protein n=1 Tax=Streptomyces iakyrus TaxID=68219 RepID=UPI000527778A|nr:TfoX/Sxy family protein [Streptomyces iakyrus]